MTPAASPEVPADLRRQARGRQFEPSRHDPDSEESRATRTGGANCLVCAACGHRITADAERISVAESHEHRFFNPAGFMFHIGCFGNAPGCVTAGQPTTEFSWFPGFAWCHALCEGCGQHLGWLFRDSSMKSFFGLILNRLAEARDRQQ